MDDVVTLLDEFVWDLHEQMAPPTELQFVQDLKAFARSLPNGICTRATACSGTEVKVHVENCLSRCWKKRYGIDIRFKHVLACEKLPLKRDFIRHEFPDLPFLSQNMELLSQDMTINCVEGEEGMANLPATIIPEFSAFGSGFPCISRTPLSSKMKENLIACSWGLVLLEKVSK